MGLFYKIVGGWGFVFVCLGEGDGERIDFGFFFGGGGERSGFMIGVGLSTKEITSRFQIYRANSLN